MRQQPVAASLVAATIVEPLPNHDDARSRADTSTDMNRMCLIPFDMSSRIFGPYLTAIYRILISVMSAGTEE
jgi:hypothetical protein